ncbi:hypothetical protein [Riemerella columbina]|nr:hypothetical protein [Riemerella columbina]
MKFKFQALLLLLGEDDQNQPLLAPGAGFQLPEEPKAQARKGEA